MLGSTDKKNRMNIAEMLRWWIYDIMYEVTCVVLIVDKIRLYRLGISLGDVVFKTSMCGK